METKKRLIEELRKVADDTPPICQYDTPHNVEVFGKEITVYCKPFEQFQELLRRAADALSVDAIEVSRLGKLGRLMKPYRGCGRGRVGPSGCVGNFKPMELDPIEDIEGDRWVPVLEDDLSLLKAKAKNAVEVEDKELLKAIKMLIKQYDHSKQSDYVHSPVAHALFHTWKKVDGDG